MTKVFRQKHHGIKARQDAAMSNRISDMEQRVEQLIVLLSQYGTPYTVTAKKISVYRKDGKI